jgi:hypothetical protein
MGRERQPRYAAGRGALGREGVANYRDVKRNNVTVSCNAHVLLLALI